MEALYQTGRQSVRHYYRATAYFHTNNFGRGEESALQAAAMDVNHDEPLVNFCWQKFMSAKATAPMPSRSFRNS
jgi:hypothetical protein